ncbi:MAG: hypothetical protein Q8Q26_07245 [Pseudorhodobacter sp.]|nr:hypothetical protein [Pseudorhodobacter sp.]
MTVDPLGCAEKRRVKGVLAGGVEGVGLQEVDLIRCLQADARVMTIFVIPGEVAAAERASLVAGLEPFGEFRKIFQRLEVGFGEQFVIRCMWPANGI